MRLRLSVVAVVVSVVLASSASAAPVAIHFAGTFQTIEPAHFFDLSQLGVGLGSLATGTIVFENSALDQLPADPTRALYQTPLLSISIASGGWSASWSATPGTDLHVDVAVVDQNQAIPNADRWSGRGSVSGHILLPTPPIFSDFELILGDSAAGANLVGDSIVPPSDVHDWQQSTLDIGFLPTGQLLSRISLVYRNN